MGCNGFIDAMAVMWLLYTNKVFFRPEDIAWDGTHHSLNMVQINATEVDDIPEFVERAKAGVQGVADLMSIRPQRSH